VPRIAVSFLWLGLIVGAVGLNMARYPGVSQMVSDACRPQPPAQAVASQAAAAQPEAAKPSLRSPPEAESKSASASQQPAPAAQAAKTAQHEEMAQDEVAAQDKKAAQHKETAPPADATARATPPTPVVQAAVTIERLQPADPLDLGNGVHRLPPVE
jgi:hypothetical protein